MKHDKSIFEWAMELSSNSLDFYQRSVMELMDGLLKLKCSSFSIGWHVAAATE
jgi:hypothetical protein